MLFAFNRLDQRPPDEVEAKRRALTAVRPAFVLGRNASMERPSAAEFVLSETCRKARIVREQPPRQPLIAGGAHRRCTLWKAADRYRQTHSRNIRGIERASLALIDKAVTVATLRRRLPQPPSRKG